MVFIIETIRSSLDCPVFRSPDRVLHLSNHVLKSDSGQTFRDGRFHNGYSNRDCDTAQAFDMRK